MNQHFNEVVEKAFYEPHTWPCREYNPNSFKRKKTDKSHDFAKSLGRSKIASSPLEDGKQGNVLVL